MIGVGPVAKLIEGAVYPKAYVLNPALLLGGSALGYLDPIILLPAVGALVAAATGHTWLTGALCAAAALTKPQGVFVAPVAALAVVNLTWDRTGWAAERLALRLGETAAGASLVAVAVLFPFLAFAGFLRRVRTSRARRPNVTTLTAMKRSTSDGPSPTP